MHGVARGEAAAVVGPDVTRAKGSEGKAVVRASQKLRLAEGALEIRGGHVARRQLHPVGLQLGQRRERLIHRAALQA